MIPTDLLGVLADLASDADPLSSSPEPSDSNSNSNSNSTSMDMSDDPTGTPETKSSEDSTHYSKATREYVAKVDSWGSPKSKMAWKIIQSRMTAGGVIDPSVNAHAPTKAMNWLQDRLIEWVLGNNGQTSNVEGFLYCPYPSPEWLRELGREAGLREEANEFGIYEKKIMNRFFTNRAKYWLRNFRKRVWSQFLAYLSGPDLNHPLSNEISKFIDLYVGRWGDNDEPVRVNDEDRHIYLKIHGLFEEWLRDRLKKGVEGLTEQPEIQSDKARPAGAAWDRHLARPLQMETMLEAHFEKYFTGKNANSDAKTSGPGPSSHSSTSSGIPNLTSTDRSPKTQSPNAPGTPSSPSRGTPGLTFRGTARLSSQENARLSSRGTASPNSLGTPSSNSHENVTSLKDAERDAKTSGSSPGSLSSSDRSPKIQSPNAPGTPSSNSSSSSRPEAPRGTPDPVSKAVPLEYTPFPQSSLPTGNFGGLPSSTRQMMNLGGAIQPPSPPAIPSQMATPLNSSPVPMTDDDIFGDLSDIFPDFQMEEIDP